MDIFQVPENDVQSKKQFVPWLDLRLEYLIVYQLVTGCFQFLQKFQSSDVDLLVDGSWKRSIARIPIISLVLAAAQLAVVVFQNTRHVVRPNSAVTLRHNRKTLNPHAEIEKVLRPRGQSGSQADNFLVRKECYLVMRDALEDPSFNSGLQSGNVSFQKRDQTLCIINSVWRLFNNHSALGGIPLICCRIQVGSFRTILPDCDTHWLYLDRTSAWKVPNDIHVKKIPIR